jgi:hypothetical protein
MQREIWQAAIAQRLQQMPRSNSIVNSKLSQRPEDPSTMPITMIVSPTPVKVNEIKPYHAINDIESQTPDMNDYEISRRDDDCNVTSISTSASPREDAAKSFNFHRDNAAIPKTISLQKTRSTNILQTIAEHLGVHSTKSKVGITTSRSASRNNSERSVFSHHSRSGYLQDCISRRLAGQFSPELQIESIYSMKSPGRNYAHDVNGDMKLGSSKDPNSNK